jgi:hypothetical protein
MWSSRFELVCRECRVRIRVNRTIAELILERGTPWPQCVYGHKLVLARIDPSLDERIAGQSADCK